MNNLKKLFATVALTGIIILGAKNAQAGVLLSDFNKKADSRPCAEKTEKTSTRTGSYNLPDFGILASGFGIIISGLTGIIIADGAKDTPNTNCGIIISGATQKNGMLLGD